ncbi:hypothetical protein Q9966_007750 [Columba livia]|nr:hypothetical protein Q9966_007750 [Columba livia]
MESSTHNRVLGVFKGYFHEDKIGIADGYHETAVQSTIGSAQQKRQQTSLVIGCNDKMQSNFFLLVGYLQFSILLRMNNQQGLSAPWDVLNEILQSLINGCTLVLPCHLVSILVPCDMCLVVTSVKVDLLLQLLTKTQQEMLCTSGKHFGKFLSSSRDISASSGSSEGCHVTAIAFSLLKQGRAGKWSELLSFWHLTDPWELFEQREATMAQAPTDPSNVETVDPEESSPNMIVYRKQMVSMRITVSMDALKDIRGYSEINDLHYLMDFEIGDGQGKEGFLIKKKKVHIDPHHVKNLFHQKGDPFNWTVTHHQESQVRDLQHGTPACWKCPCDELRFFGPHIVDRS